MGGFELAVLVLLVVIAYRVERVLAHVRAIDARTDPDDQDDDLGDLALEERNSEGKGR